MSLSCTQTNIQTTTLGHTPTGQPNCLKDSLNVIMQPDALAKMSMLYNKGANTCTALSGLHCIALYLFSSLGVL